jgi:hypothetical protein
MTSPNTGGKSSVSDRWPEEQDVTSCETGSQQVITLSTNSYVPLIFKKNNNL